MGTFRSSLADSAGHSDVFLSTDLKKRGHAVFFRFLYCSGYAWWMQVLVQKVPIVHRSIKYTIQRDPFFFMLRGRLSGVRLERAVHPLMRAVKLRRGRPDELDTDAETSPPDT